MSIFKNMKPIFIENSKVPVFLSKFAPIDIWAINFGPFVWCKGVLSKTTRRHETIHYHQQLELLFVFQWILYGLFWLVGYGKYLDGKEAYRQNPFEQEAYDNEKKFTYLAKRKPWAWRKYKI
tara:strand:+ start:1864 stop:2229 length:366 start_codon:yes stop_codon:yes gene_type:complete